MYGQDFLSASRGPFRVRFQRRSPGDTTLSELRQSEVLFKVGTLSYNWSTIGVARKCASTVCGDRQRRRHVTCASCTSVCYTPPVHPMHYTCSCATPTQEHARLASPCFPQLLSPLCSLHCVPPTRFLLICAPILPSSPSLNISRCSRRLLHMHVHGVHLRLPKSAIASCLRT